MISIPRLPDTTVLKNIRVAGRRTSMKLEQLEWQSLARICAAEGISVDQFCERADRDPERVERSRTSRVRVAPLAKMDTYPASAGFFILGWSKLVAM